MVAGKQDKKNFKGKKSFKSFHKKDAKPKSLEDLKKKISGKGFTAKKGEKHGNGKHNKKFEKKPADSAPQSKNAAKAASQLNYSHKPYSKLVEQMKVQWNRLREHSTSQEVKTNIVKEMLKAMSEHVMDITLRHDAARIVQAIIQFGNVTQQDAVLSEIQGKMGEVAKTPYGHFVILKALNYCNQKPQMKKISQALQGSFVSLGTHVIGARVVETILQLYPTQISRALKAEFYGKKFTILLSETPKNLSELIAGLPTKTAAILDHMRDLALKFIQKNLISFVYTHHLLWEYVQELAKQAAASNQAENEEGTVANQKANNRINELVNALAEAGPKLLSTKPGAKVMTFVITQSTAKDRKRIIKSLKGHVLESLVHESAYLGIMRLLDVVDDTVNVHKSFFDELKSTERTVQYAANGEILGHKDPAWLQICLHHNAHKLILRLLTPNQRHLENDESAVLDVKSPFSKKADDLRRKEHIVYIKPVLLNICTMYTSDLVRSRFGSKVLQAVYESFAPESLANALALVFADQFVEVKAEDGKRATGKKGDGEEEDEEEGDEEEEDEEERDDDEEDEEEEEDDDDEALPDEFGGEDEEEVVDDEEFQTLLAEEQAEKTTQSKPSSQKEAKELLPIEEDACAHVLLKKLLQFETGFVLSQYSESDFAKNNTLRILRQYQTEDNAQHHSNNSSTLASSYSAQLEFSVADLVLEPAGVGQRLLSLFQSSAAASFQRYLHCNRGCFALHALFQVPGLFKNMHSMWADLCGDNSLQASVAQHEGGKLLLKLLAASERISTELTAPKTAEKRGRGTRSRSNSEFVEAAVVEETAPVRSTRAGKRSRSNTEDSTDINAAASDNESVASSTASATRRSSRSAATASSAEADTSAAATQAKKARLQAVAEDDQEDEEENDASAVGKKRGRKSVTPSIPESAPKSAKKTPSKRNTKVPSDDEPDAEEESSSRRSTRGRKAT